MLFKFLVSLKAIVDVVVRNQIFISSINTFAISQWLPQRLPASFSLSEHGIYFFKGSLYDVNILEPDVSELSRSLSQEIMVKVQLIRKGCLVVST